MSLADSLHRMYELGHDGEEAPSAPEQPWAMSGTEILRRIHALPTPAEVSIGSGRADLR